MKSVKAPTTKSYDESLTEALRDPQQAAAYLQAALEDSATEPELLQAVLMDLASARSTDRSDSANFVSQPMHKAIPDLMLWLETIGLQLSVTPIAQGGTVAEPQSLTAIEAKAA
jgi:DNA-binding phage protein